MTSALNKRLVNCLSEKYKKGSRSRSVLNDDIVKLFNEVQELLEHGADPNHFSKGTTPLCEACRAGWKDIAVILLKSGASLNLCDKNNCSPVYLAASHGHLQLVLYLIDSGANINIKTAQGYLPLLTAVENNHMDTANVLIDAGADVNVTRPNSFMIEISLLTYVLFAKNDFNLAEKLLLAGVVPHPVEKSLNFLLLGFGDECRNFVKKLVYAGFNFYSDSWINLMKSKLMANPKDVTENERDMLEFLEIQFKRAQSLQRLCRVVIRQSVSLSPLKIHMRKKLEKLPLPKQMHRFLALDFS
ncbi:hypothetical protein ACJMK2_013433 [Sinanodonta woodiana]|uniref:SOCS box domain-containing protein n=1 Tax=Sinanodonta woodiana TaxID=1069815 RepID=A0ABD3V0R1_SINWO